MSVHKTNVGSYLGSGSKKQHLCMLLVGFLFVCITSLSAHAQFTRFQNLSDEQGLGNLAVEAIAQDQDDYILLGTQAGLYRYDGNSIVPFAAETLAGRWIEKIISDEAGRVWVDTRNGLYVRYGSTFSKVDTGKMRSHLLSPHFFAVRGASAVFGVDGKLLLAPIGTRSIGAFKPLFEAATLARVPELGNARFIVSDAHDGLLIGCGVAICHEKAGQVTVIGKAEGLPPDAWQVALQTPDGTLWVRSLDRLARRRLGEARFTVVNMSRVGGSDVAVAGVHTSYASNPAFLELLSDGHCGILTQDVNGLVDWNGTTWHAYPHHTEGLSNLTIISLAFDREGSLWAGSRGRGVFRSLGLGNWEHWTEDDGLPSNTVWSITRLLNRQLWAATDGGAVAVGSAVARLGNDTSYIGEATRGGRLWLAPHGSQMMRFDPVHGMTERFPSLGRVYNASVDKDNRLWIGTRTGLFLVADADAPTPDVHPDLVLTSENAFITLDLSGAVWAVSPQGAFRRNAAGRFVLMVHPALFRSVP